MAATPTSFTASPEINGPAYDGVALDGLKSDTIDLTNPVRFIYIGSIAAGATLKIRTLAGVDLQFAGLNAGMVLPFAAKRIWSTGSLAASLVGGF